MSLFYISNLFQYGQAIVPYIIFPGCHTYLLSYILPLAFIDLSSCQLRVVYGNNFAKRNQWQNNFSQLVEHCLYFFLLLLHCLCCGCFRKKLLLALPSLKQLDGEDITREEKLEAGCPVCVFLCFVLDEFVQDLQHCTIYWLSFHQASEKVMHLTELVDFIFMQAVSIFLISFTVFHLLFWYKVSERLTIFSTYKFHLEEQFKGKIVFVDKMKLIWVNFKPFCLSLCQTTLFINHGGLYTKVKITTTKIQTNYNGFNYQRKVIRGSLIKYF